LSENKGGIMEARDTVMDEIKFRIALDKGLGKLGLIPNLRDLVVAQAQAEISFKAGRESRQNEIDELNSIINSKLKLEREAINGD
jgi:hypothetical protein